MRRLREMVNLRFNNVVWVKERQRPTTEGKSEILISKSEANSKSEEEKFKRMVSNFEIRFSDFLDRWWVRVAVVP